MVTTAYLNQLHEAQLAFDASSQRLGRARYAVEHSDLAAPDHVGLLIELDEATRYFAKCCDDLTEAKRGR